MCYGVRGQKGKHYIAFAECANNFRCIYGGEGSCVGFVDRSGSNHSVEFFTAPLITEIFFMNEQTMEADLKGMIAAVEQRGYSLREDME